MSVGDLPFSIFKSHKPPLFKHSTVVMAGVLFLPVHGTGEDLHEGVRDTGIIVHILVAVATAAYTI